MKGTPKTLEEAITNGIYEIFETSANTATIESHIRDFLAQRFGAMMLREENFQPSDLGELFEQITGEKLKLESHELGAVEAERERCAKIVEANLYQWVLDTRQPFAAEFNLRMKASIQGIAKVIRSGK
jgi:hypothetical protein